MKNKTVEYFAKDRFANYTGINIDEVDRNKAVCSLIIEDHHLNAKDYIQGGVIFTLADFTFAVAANARSVSEDTVGKTVSMSADIKFLKPGDGKILTAKASKIKEDGRISLYEVLVINDRNEVIAKAEIKGFEKK